MSDRSMMAHSPAHQRSQSLALLPSRARGSVARKVPKRRTSQDGPGSPRQTALPGTWRVRLEQWFRSFALPLNVFSQKCNTALYSFVFTKNTAQCESPLLFPLPFQHCPAGGPRQAGGLQCVYRATAGSPQSISQSRSRPREWTPSRLQTDCRGHRGSWAGSSGALSEQ